MLKLPAPKFRPELSAPLKDIAEKQIPAKLKSVVDTLISVRGSFPPDVDNYLIDFQ